MSRTMLILLPAIAAAIGGCVMVPQTTLSDGTPNPSHQLSRLLHERHLVLHQSSLCDSVNRLSEPGTGGTAGQPSANSTHPAWYANPQSRQLVLSYDEPVRMYGVTLNQHLFYIPMPVRGAMDDQQVGLVLSFDKNLVLTAWSRQLDIDFSRCRPFDPLTCDTVFKHDP